MRCVELNSIGNYNHWEVSKLNELQKNIVSSFSDDDLLFENDFVNVWELKLEPQERLPFKRINSNYEFVALTKILAITRWSNAIINLINFNKGTSYNLNFRNKNKICDLENINNEKLHICILEFKNKTEE